MSIMVEMTVEEFLGASKDFGGGFSFCLLLSHGLALSGLTSREFAREVGVAPSTVSRWASGTSEPLVGMQKVVITKLRKKIQAIGADPKDVVAVELTPTEREALDARVAAENKQLEAMGLTPIITSSLFLRALLQRELKEQEPAEYRPGHRVTVAPMPILEREAKIRQECERQGITIEERTVEPDGTVRLLCRGAFV